MKSGSSQFRVVMWISVMENQEIDVITFFYERGKSKADYIRNESAQMLVWANSREYLRKCFFVVGTGSFILWKYFENFS